MTINVEVPLPTLEAVASACGLLAQLSLLSLVAFMARIPILTRRLDLVTLLQVHKVLGFTAVTCSVIHVGAQLLKGRNVTESVPLLAAGAALGLLILTGLSAIPVSYTTLAKHHYEQWHLTHLMAVPALLLSTVHELNGPTIEQVGYRVTWVLLHGLVAVAYVVFRWFGPLLHNRFQRYKVQRVKLVRAASRTTPTPLYRIDVAGQALDDLRPIGARALGYAYVRFRKRHSPQGPPHPYSVTRVLDADSDHHLELLVNPGYATRTTCPVLPAVTASTSRGSMAA